MLSLLNPTNPRYTFRKIFWITTGVNSIFYLIAIIMVAITTIGGKAYDWHAMIDWPIIAKEAVGILATSLYFYASLNCFHWLIAQKKRWTRFIPAVLLSMASVMCYQFALNHAFVVSVESKVQKGVSLSGRIAGSIIASLFVTGLSLLIVYLNNLREEQKRRKVLEQQKMELEVENARANLNFLKAQINPHFLHNTLNFLYVKALPLSEELSEGIATLSDIMRYALSNANSTSGQALLREEIEHLENVIKINKLRFNNNLPVAFTVEGELDGARIIPFVLITIVENAFKHGDLQSPEHPVDIKIQVEGRSLNFYCRNKKKTGTTELSTKLGLSNIQKRLEQAYGSNHSFYVRDGAEFYTTELTIHAL